MSYNGSGVYARVPGSAYTNGTTADGSEVDAEMNDIASALTNAVCKDGQSTMTGNLKMGSNKVTGLAAPGASGDALSQGAAASVTTLTTSSTATIGGNTAITGTISATGVADFDSAGGLSGSDAIRVAGWGVAMWNSTNHLNLGGVNSSQWQVLNFYTAGSARARIDANGNLLVGTTSGTKHTLSKSNASTYAAHIINSSATQPYGLEITYSGAAPNDTDSHFISGDDTSTTRFTIDSSGTYADLSSIQAKKDIRNAEAQSAKILAIQIKRYRWKEQRPEDSTEQIGYIAEQVEAHYPEAIRLGKHGEKLVAMKPIVMGLIATVQELSNRITALEAAPKK